MAGVTPNPREYGLPHDLWRPGQLEVIRELETLTGCDDDGFAVVEAPTGSGKTSYSRALARERRVIALCRTRNLQVLNYAEAYGAAPLYGRAAYNCVLPEGRGLTCEDCLYGDDTRGCPAADRCPYLLARDAAISSPYATLNYAYWLTNAGFRRKSPPNILFMDEAHNLPDIVIEFTGTTVTEAERAEFDLPAFPLILRDRGCALLNIAPPADAALAWLSAARDALVPQYRRLRSKASQKSLKALHRIERLGQALARVRDALAAGGGQDWYIRSGPAALRGRPGFLARPLTARWDFKRYFTGPYDGIAVSATIGDPTTFCAELGITPSLVRQVPNQYPLEARRVYELDVPRMGSRSKPDFDARAEKQAEQIARFIECFPPTWSGIIHVTRKAEEKDLCRRLAQRDSLESRLWVVPGKQENYIPTDQQVQAWKQRLARTPGSLLVSCSFAEGYDGLDERICISAKVPFPPMGEDGSYEHAWMLHDNRRYRLRAAVTLAQQLGRTRRGRPEDYDTDALRGACAVADGSLGQVRKYLPGDLTESLVKF